MARRRTSSSGSVTIRDVARHAGVSVATVSRALRGSDLVHPDTRRRVAEAAEELRFTPNRLARSLAERRHAANGIVFPDLSGPYYADVVLGYEEVAASLGRSVLILSTHNRDSADEMVRDLAARVDGLAVFGRTVHDPVIAEIVERGLPVVLMARREVDGADSVRTENTSSVIALVEHLLGHGHQTFAFLGDPVTSPDVAERWDAFRRTLDTAGIAVPDAPIGGGFKEDDGAVAAAGLLDGPSLPDVVVCANDELALGLMVRLRDAGLRVPEDVAVTGWDDVMAARFAGLTTVRQPMREMGARAAQLLDARITGNPPEIGATDTRDASGDTTGDIPWGADANRGKSHHQILPTELIVRYSCGPHPQEDRR